MKKTLTVNLGGTVFHIDEDAYQLLDKYLNNLRIHFIKEEGSQEIINDFELRISELFGERVRLGYEIITISDVEEIIKRMGKPEEIFGEENMENSQDTSSSGTAFAVEKKEVKKRLFRDPDNRVLGGVLGGIAAYMDWDPILLRLIAIFLALVPWTIISTATLVIIYIILWLIIPVANTATEKLQMRGEKVTIENIGKSVTEGFEKISSQANDFVTSGKTRSGIRNFIEALIDIVGFLLKVLLIIVGIIGMIFLLPVIFIMFVVLSSLLFGGGLGLISLLSDNMPFVPWDYFSGVSNIILGVGCLATILMIGIPVGTLIYVICSYIFKLKPVSSRLKWILVVLWIISFAFNVFATVKYGIPFLGEWKMMYYPEWQLSLL